MNTNRIFRVTIENAKGIRFFSGRSTRIYTLALEQARQLREGLKKGFNTVIIEN